MFLISLHAASCCNVFILHMTSSCVCALRGGGRHDVMRAGPSCSLIFSLSAKHTHSHTLFFCILPSLCLLLHLRGLLLSVSPFTSSLFMLSFSLSFTVSSLLSLFLPPPPPSVPGFSHHCNKSEKQPRFVIPPPDLCSE